MEAEFRFAPFAVAGRTLTGRAVVYGDVAPQFRERFEPGAFGELPAIPLNLQHDRSLVILEPGAFDLVDGPAALHVRAELHERSAAIALVKRRVLKGFSVEFNSIEQRMDRGIRVIEKAELTGIALVDRGAYPMSTAEVRALAGESGRMRRLWL